MKFNKVFTKSLTGRTVIIPVRTSWTPIGIAFLWHLDGVSYINVVFIMVRKTIFITVVFIITIGIGYFEAIRSFRIWTTTEVIHINRNFGSGGRCSCCPCSSCCCCSWLETTCWARRIFSVIMANINMAFESLWADSFLDWVEDESLRYKWIIWNEIVTIILPVYWKTYIWKWDAGSVIISKLTGWSSELHIISSLESQRSYTSSALLTLITSQDVGANCNPVIGSPSLNFIPT